MTDTSIVLYGIANCDTVKKTRQFLDTIGIAYQFHDYKKAGLDKKLANQLVDAIPLDSLINKRGTTWRKLSLAEQQGLDQRSAPMLISANPSVVRRPILRHPNGWMVGYDETQFRLLASE